MIGQKGILGLMILALIGSFAGLSLLGLDMASAFADSMGVMFLTGVVAALWGVNLNGADVQGILRDAPYPNVVYGTAASEVMNLRNQEQAQDLRHRLDENERRILGQ
jgi:hypothetical protein